ncbi:hypothetical protein S245_024813, partial [Arachis hypogaea]
NNQLQGTEAALICQNPLADRTLCHRDPRRPNVDPCLAACLFFNKFADVEASKCNSSGQCICTYPNPHPECPCMGCAPPQAS